MLTGVPIWYVQVELPTLSSVSFNKKRFDPIGSQALAFFLQDPIGLLHSDTFEIMLKIAFNNIDSYDCWERGKHGHGYIPW